MKPGFRSGAHSLIFLGCGVAASGAAGPPPSVNPFNEALALVFADEFDGTRLDPAVWESQAYDKGLSRDTARGPDNLEVRDGELRLHVRKEARPAGQHRSKWTAGFVSTRATIEKQIDDYFIFEIDGNPVACVALHVFPDQRTGELASLYVSPAHENQGIGRKLTHFVEDRARALGVTRLLALSTQAFTYFQSKAGFTEGTPDDLPPARRERYEQSGRKSKVLVKPLA